jgi:hypothetical protein
MATSVLCIRGPNPGKPVRDAASALNPTIADLQLTDQSWKRVEMNKAEKILKSIAFLLGSLFTAGLFSAFAAWAMSSLDPAVQQAIGNLNSPLIAAEATRSAAGIEPVTILDERRDFTRPASPGTTDR